MRIYPFICLIFKRRLLPLEEKLKPIKDAVKRLKQTVKPHLFSNSVLGQHARTLYWKGVQWQLMTMGIGYKAMNLSKDIVGAVSVDFLMYSGHVTLAEHWFIMESVATEKIAKGEGNKEYYEAQIQVSLSIFLYATCFTYGYNVRRLRIMFSSICFLVLLAYAKASCILLMPPSIRQVPLRPNTFRSTIRCNVVMSLPNFVDV